MKAESADTPEATFEALYQAIGRRVWEEAGEHLSQQGHRDLVFGTTWQNVMAAVHQGFLDVWGCKCPPFHDDPSEHRADCLVYGTAVSTPPDEHDCEACEDCIHNGNKCCGCYDGVCCKEAPVPEHTEIAGIAYDDDGPFLPGHHDVSYDLGTPRQYTARGGWNVSCECGVTFAESGDEDFEERWLQHLTDLRNPPGKE